MHLVGARIGWAIELLDQEREGSMRISRQSIACAVRYTHHPVATAGLAAAIVFFSAFGASATLLEGREITTAFYFPNQSTIGFGGVPVVSTIGPGIEIAASPQGFPITSIDFSDTSITLDFTASLVGSVASFNGWRFYDVSGVTFTGATLITSLPGWVVTFDPTDIWLNGSGATYFVGSTLQIDITGISSPESIPEPAAFPLTLTAIALAGFSIKYSRQKGV